MNPHDASSSTRPHLLTRRSTRGALGLLLSGLALGAAGACTQGDISGRLGATTFGDLSNPLAERIQGRPPLSEACGPSIAPPRADYQFLRSPYLQQVAAGSANLLWVAPSDPRPAALITTPDGTVLAEGGPEGDGSARVIEGATQWALPVSGLEPSTTYCYELRDGDLAVARAGFRTPPTPGENIPVRFLAFGDSGEVGADQDALLAQMHTVAFDLMIHTGDIAYETGTREELQRNFFDVYAEFLLDYPMFPITGNHEYKTEDAAPFREAFDLPKNGGPDGIERWYSFDWGDVHFVALDTERIGPVQAAWLEADLATNERPWTVVFAHRPPYSSGYHGSDVGFRTHFRPILEKYQVQLVLNGHDHHYERTTPQNGVVYVVTGGGGRGVKGTGWSEFTAFSESVIHFVYVTVQGEQLAMHAIDGLGQEFDQLVLDNPRR